MAPDSRAAYDVPVGDVVWEIDEFVDRTLVLAEVELERVDQAVVVPDWIGRVLEREVTDEPNYTNFRLAR
jgi:adenylate cyclase